MSQVSPWSSTHREAVSGGFCGFVLVSTGFGMGHTSIDPLDAGLMSGGGGGVTQPQDMAHSQAD